MKYLILTLSLLSFFISSLLFVKEFNLAELKQELEHTGLFKDAGAAFTHDGKETLVCYRQTHRNFYILLMTMSISSLGFIYYAFVQKNQLSKKLIIINNEVVLKNQVIEEKNTEIISGINYAKHLQRAMLSNTNILKEYFSKYLIINRPKDIVSGDFYWVEKVGSYIFIAVADCTGHGVPGAFMTILGNSLLNQIVLENKIISTSEILSELNKRLFQTFVTEKEIDKVNDGMDIAIIRFDCLTKEVLFSGARRNLLVLSNDNCNEVKGSRQSLGAEKNHNTPFGEEALILNKGERIYLYTDGVTDQLGGENYKKFMTKNFKELLNSNKSLDLNQQREMIKGTITKWKGNNIQTDDILILGLEI